MFKKIVALLLVLVFPTVVSAGPLRESAERLAAQTAVGAGETSGEKRARSRWPGIALIAAGGLAIATGGLEVFDDEEEDEEEDDDDDGRDDDDDDDEEEEGEDDEWGNRALVGGGMIAAAVGAVLLHKALKSPGTSLSVGRRHVAIRHTIRF